LLDKKYVGKDGTIIFVSKGLGKEYGTFRQSGSGGLHRLKSSELPMVATKSVAQNNLDAWAKKKGLKAVEDQK
jgi:hypothetical protein